MNRMVKLLPFLLIFLLTHSCSEETIVQPPVIDGELQLDMSIQKPASTNPISTRANHTAEECNIKNISILVFEQNESGTDYEYKYYKEAQNIRRSDDVSFFTVYLEASDRPVRLVVIANTTINEAVWGKNALYDDVKSKFIVNFPQNQTSYFPMYGEYTLNKPLSPASKPAIPAIKMLRTIAKANVVNRTDNFELENIRVYRARKDIQVIPNIMDWNNFRVTTPSIPMDDEFYTTHSDIVNVVSGETSITEKIYVPESGEIFGSAQTKESTCIVVGGKFNGSNETTYYRIDFASGKEGHPFGQILRNYMYQFEITKVTGPGLKDPDEAALTFSVHMECEIKDWEMQTNYMVWYGAYYFGVSSRNVRLPAKKDDPGNPQTIQYETNLDKFFLHFSDPYGNEYGERARPDHPDSLQISDSYFDVKLIPGQNKIEVSVNVDNPFEYEREKYMVAIADYWKVLFKITQEENTGKPIVPRVIKIMSSNGTGCLGSGTLSTSLSNAYKCGENKDARATRAILNNNFGPNRKVNIPNIQFSVMPGNDVCSYMTKYLASGILNDMDIVFLTEGTRTPPAIAQRMLNWVQAQENRVLVVSFDFKAQGVKFDTPWSSYHSRNTSNFELVKWFWSNNIIDPYWYNNKSDASCNELGREKNKFSVPFDMSSYNDYFLKTGPFTESDPVTENPYHYIYSGYWGSAAIPTAEANNIKPLIVYKDDVRGETRLVLGVDYKRRIVYVGDSDIFVHKTRNDRIYDTSGTLNNRYSRIIANLWAWMINEVVLKND